MRILLIGILMGLGVGFLIGFCLGLEDRRRCAVCLSEGTQRHRTGYQAGWHDGVQETVRQLRRRDRSRTEEMDLRKGELDEIEQELLEAAEC